MSGDDVGDLLLDQVERLLGDHAGTGALRGVEHGVWPAALWDACAALGLPGAMAPEALGGAALGWRDAGRVFAALGRSGAPVPLGEAMVAGALLGAAGVAPGDGFVTFATDDAGAVPWGRAAARVAVVRGSEVAVLAPREWTRGANLAGEPRDAAEPGAAVVDGGWLGAEAGALALALLRAAQIAGALDAVLELTVDYANTRKQFGRAIGGFQAVQQAMAVFASEVAAAGVAVAHACRMVDRVGLDGALFEIACAKIVAGEAAGVGATTAHQVHAAIGFTEDYSLQLFTRRLWAWRDEGGQERHWARRIGAAALSRGGAALWPDLTARGAGA